MPYKFSASSLGLLKECPRCFWIQFNKGIKRPESIFPSLPSGMDKVLKNHFDRFMERKELPPELRHLECMHGCSLFDDKEKLSLWRNNRKGIEWADKDGNILKGAVDNILKKGEKLIVIDFKTRGFPLKEDTATHYDDQLNIYNFLLRKNGFRTEDFSYLLFYYPSSVNEDGSVVFSTELVKVDVDIEAAEKLFKDALKCLKGEMPVAAEGCEWCRWREKLTSEKIIN